jgi:hypothetical protein
MNPAPDADVHSVGQENFNWVVNAVAEMAVQKALAGENPAEELRWAAFLEGEKAPPQKAVRKSAPKAAPMAEV